MFGSFLQYTLHRSYGLPNILVRALSIMISGQISNAYTRLQCRRLGNSFDVSRSHDEFRGLLCSAVPARYVHLHIICMILIDYYVGMCESCVAPILILIISMFYKKDEQVGAVISYALYAY